MSIHKPNPARRWISVMLVFYLVALLLPAQHVSAAAQEIVIPKEEVDALIFQAIWQQDFQTATEAAAKGSAKPRKNSLFLYPEKVVYGEFLIRAIYTTPEVWKRFEKKYLETIAPNHDLADRKTKSYDEILFTMLDVASEMPELHPYVRDVWQTLGRSDNDLSRDRSRRIEIIESARRYGKRQQLLQRGPTTMKQVFKSAQTIPQVAANFDILFGEEIGTSISTFNAYDYITQNPDSLVPPAIVERMRTDGTINVSLNDLKQFSQIEFDKINTSIDDIQHTLGEIDKQQTVLIDYINNQQERERMQALAAAKAAEHKLNLDALHSSVFILSTLAGLIDEKYGKDLAIVGKSTLEVYESVTGWMDAVAGLSTLDKVGSLSTVVMTGNVLGSVMNIVSLFGDASPSPDQMILAEIGKLRQQVDQLRTEMHNRFDRIDAELNTIYNTMQDRFNLIDVQLGKINGNIQEVQTALVALDLKLSRIERNNFEFLDALGRRPLLDAINGGLGYQARTGLPMPYQPEFIEYENVLHTWGTIHAFDALATGPTQRDYSASALLGELNDYPLDANLNYLNGWLTANGYPAISNKRLPSPRDWLFATRAYTQLALEWPAHMQQIDPQRQAQLDAISTDVEAAMHNISTLNTMTGTLGNTLLFSHVITYYQDKLAALDGSIQTVEAAFVQEMRAAADLKRTAPNEMFNLYGGIDQTLAYTAPQLSQMPYGEIMLPVPTNLNAHIPNRDRYNLADYFRIGTLATLLGGQLLNSRPICQPGQDVCDQLGDLQVSIRLYFGDVVLTELAMTVKNVRLKGEEDPGDYVAQHWLALKPRFEANATVIPPSPTLVTQRTEQLNTVTTQLEEKLAGYQHQLYGRVLNQLNTGPLHAHAVEIAGSKALLDSFVTLGLPRAVDNDDFLRAMLYGNQQLVNDSQIIHSYAISATQPITGANLLVNPRLVTGQMAEQRTVVFNRMLNAYLAAITAQTHVEASDYLANARRELDLTRRIAQVDEPPVTPVPPTTPTTPVPPTTPTTPVPPITPAPPSTAPERLYLPLLER